MFMHWHDEFEINFVYEGTGEFICNGVHYFLNAEEAVVLTPKKLHAIYPAKGSYCRYDTIVFSTNMLGLNENDRCVSEYILPLLAQKYDIFPVISSDKKELVTCLKEIFLYAKKNNACADMLLKSKLLQLIGLLCASDSLITNNPYVSAFKQFYPVIDYINLHYMEEITVEELAQKMNVSKSHFMKSFKKATGSSAIDYLISVRIRSACQALQETKLSISEIAFNCGFKNLSNFNRHFKNLTGYTPYQYRKSFPDAIYS